MNKKNIVIFSGAGLDKESGISTFRDVKDGMWNNYKIDEVATPEGWRKDRGKVLEFYNQRRRELINVEPNRAHKAIALLEKHHNVVNITQNVSDLLERGGSTNVIHLHGELTKARGSLYHNKVSVADDVIDIGYNDINIGDKCKVTDSQLRPHIVWFGEYPFGVQAAYDAIYDADVLLIIGTSLQITYTLAMLNNVRQVGEPCKVVYIDPQPSKDLNSYGLKVEYIEKGAVEGVTEIVDRILKNEL